MERIDWKESWMEDYERPGLSMLQLSNIAWYGCHFMSIGDMTSMSDYHYPLHEEIIPYLKIKLPGLKDNIDRGASVAITRPKVNQDGVFFIDIITVTLVIVHENGVDETQVEEFFDFPVCTKEQLTRFYWKRVREMFTKQSIVLFWMEHVAKLQEQRRIALADRGIIEDY